MIEPHSGTISVARPLDWEKKSNYNLNISITDGVDVIYQKVNNYTYFFNAALFSSLCVYNT